MYRRRNLAGMAERPPARRRIHLGAIRKPQLPTPICDRNQFPAVDAATRLVHGPRDGPFISLIGIDLWRRGAGVSRRPVDGRLTTLQPMNCTAGASICSIWRLPDARLKGEKLPPQWVGPPVLQCVRPKNITRHHEDRAGARFDDIRAGRAAAVKSHREGIARRRSAA